MPVEHGVSSPVDPQREASRVKREQRRERDREHHRESRGSAQRSRGTTAGQRSDRESSVPHSEQEYAISTKVQLRAKQTARLLPYDIK